MLVGQKAYIAKEQVAMNPLIALQEQGQSVWLDFLAHRFLADGDLKRLIEQDGLAGVTSNPSIFEKAIADGTDYDAALGRLEGQDDFDAMTIYERLAIEDIKYAADELRSVFNATERHDGYVSFEVSPYLAMNTEATVTEARRLWRCVGRENVMIKVPATEAGLPAIRQLISEGININITLLFSQNVYEEVVEAYFSGLEHFVAQGGNLAKVASVASFFVSRIDVAVEKLIKERQTGQGAESEELTALGGKVAIANAKLVYQCYQRLFSGERWEKLRTQGAQVQRLLWASTSMKNPAYSDVLYVEELIAPETVNTVPPATMDAFRDHGKVRASLEEDIAGAKRIMADLDRLSISIDKVTKKLVEDGVRLFTDAFDTLLGAIAQKRTAFLGDALDSQSYKLPEKLNAEVNVSLEAWRSAGNVRRVWIKDASLWTAKDEAKWLGWLDIIGEQQTRIECLEKIAEDIHQQNFSYILLLGMGGSSLGPEVFAKTFGRQQDRPELLILDSIDPEQIRSFENRIDLSRTLFIVSSKSGSTLEPNILKQYFFERVKTVVGVEHAGSRFIAITDPDSQLQKIAKNNQFRYVAFGEPEIGGRYSVLSDFGMMPAAAMGIDVGKLLTTAQKMVRSCAASVPPADNPGVVLGTIIGVLGRTGYDKVTIIASPGIADFGAWLEQLLAESAGKQGRGLIPIDGEPLGSPEVYGQDRLFVYIRLMTEADTNQDRAVTAFEQAGHPVVRIAVTDLYHIGQEFFRWELAMAVAGAFLEINPFDQPDVEASKVKTRELTSAYEKSGKLPPETPILEESGLKLFADDRNEKDLREIRGRDTLAEWLKAHFARLNVDDYCALLAYVECNQRHCDMLQNIRVLIRDRKRVATCLGFGPRFLHSTGQVYKGGPNTGVFLQITCCDAADLAVPDQKYSFGIIKAAEARADFEVLAERGRRLLRVHLGSNVVEGLMILEKAVREALE